MSDLNKHQDSTRQSISLDKQFSTPLQRTVGLKQTLTNNYPPRSEAVPTPPQRTRSLKSRLKCPQVESTSSLCELQESLDSLSSIESKSSFSPGTELLKFDEENSLQSKGLRRKLPFQSEGQSPLIKTSSRRLSDVRSFGRLPEKKSSTEELPDFFSSPTLSEMSFSEKGLRRTSASTNLVANGSKLMEEPDSAASLSSKDDESDMEKTFSPKPKKR